MYSILLALYFYPHQTFISFSYLIYSSNQRKNSKDCMKKTTGLKIVIVGIILLLETSSVRSAYENITYSVESVDKNDFYYTYDDLTDLLSLLQTQYPGIFSYSSLTKTYQGRDVWLVKISDNVLMNESEPQILFMGGVHGNEKPGFQAVIYSLKSIVENSTTPFVNESFTLRIRQIINSTELFFIPMVNPDGIEASTRKNCRPNNCFFGQKKLCGVDINRNYDYNWEDVSSHPIRYIILPRSLEQLRILLSGDTNNYLFERTAVRFPITDFGSFFGLGFYRGPSAFSENESTAVREFIKKHHVTISVDYHSHGEKIHYPQPWNFTNPTDNTTFLSLAENISKINGYTVIQRMNWSNLSGNYPYWAYMTYGVYPLTIELCKTKEQNQNPDADYLVQLFYTHLLGNLYLAERTMI